MSYDDVIDVVSKAIEACGILAIVVGGVYAFTTFTVATVRHREAGAYDALRRTLGRSILLGLEVLVAADIIRTIAITPTFTSVGVLGLIVVVRTFLSFSLEAELEGRLPFQRRPGPEQPTTPG